MPRSLDSLFDEPADAVGEILSIERVPNAQPFIHGTPYKIAIIGEAPGKDEVAQGKPFVGWSGKDLDRYLSRFGILRDACFIGNICQQRPPANQIASFDWDGPEIQNGLHRLSADLLECPRPNLCILLGGSALHAFKSPLEAPKRRKKGKELAFAFPNSIRDWRGTFFESHAQSPLPGVKCMATYHPAACMHQYEWTPYLLLDLMRAAQQATSPTLILPLRNLRHTLSFEDTIFELDKLSLSSEPFGTDIEGYWNYFKCISFAPRPDYSFIVPFVHMNGQSYWTVDEETQILIRISRLMASPRSRKTWQNGLYDRFAMQYGNNIVCRGRNHDIMLAHWELHCELEKSLAVQASIYTDEPFYKSDYKSNNTQVFHEYCCRDSAVTIEIFEKLQRRLPTRSWQHYEFNETLLNALLYMELRGIKYDKEKAKLRSKEIENSIYELQYSLDSICGRGLPTNDKTLLRSLVRDTLCYKRDSSKIKKGNEETLDRAMAILFSENPLSTRDLGFLSTALDKNLNVKGQDLKDYLYDTLKLPTQYSPTTGAITADYGALITLRKKSKHPSLPIVIEMGELIKRQEMLQIDADPDGRIRSSYNEVGGKTGRVSSKTSPTGSGTNLQTLPDKNELKPLDHYLHLGMRDLCVADTGCYLAKLDLKGADGWTIGANLAALGDSTMLDDLRFGLKPAHFPCYARRHGLSSLSGLDRISLAKLFQEIKKSDWDYFAAKQCTWGFCYLMGLAKAASHIFEVSEGTVSVSEADMQIYKDAIFRRYNVQLWHRAMERKLFNQPYPPKLLSPSGHLREFFGRKSDIVGQALAHEPQSVTTYAVNLAVYNCWTDRDNRIRLPNKRGHRLRVEPLHQVHDEAVFQFKIEDTAWATAKIKSWFNNIITIAGIPLTIPFEGAYGTDWSMDEKAKIGDI